MKERESFQNDEADVNVWCKGKRRLQQGHRINLQIIRRLALTDPTLPNSQFLGFTGKAEPKDGSGFLSRKIAVPARRTNEARHESHDELDATSPANLSIIRFSYFAVLFRSS